MPRDTKSATLALEKYTAERMAEFLLSNAVSVDDYAWALAEVKSMGMNPCCIPHFQLFKAR